MSFRFLDRWQARLLNASPVEDPGLLHTLAWSGPKTTGALPRLYWVSDALPRMVVGPGQIFVTQALVGLLPEVELRAVLQEGVRSVTQNGFRLRRLTFFGILATGVLKWAPVEWVEMVFLSRSGKSHVLSDEKGPLGLLWFLIVLSLFNAFKRLGGRGVADWRGAPSDSYLRAIDRISRITGDIDNIRFLGFSGLAPLGLGMKKNLLSLSAQSR